MAPWKGDYFWPLFSVRDAKAGWEWQCTFLFWSARPPTTWLRHHRSKERTKFHLFCRGHPARLTLPTAAATPGFSQPRGSNPMPPSPAPAPLPRYHEDPWALLLQGRGAQAVPQSPPWPMGGWPPSAVPCPAGSCRTWARLQVFAALQQQKWFKSSGQAASDCKAKPEPEQCYALAERGILSRLNTWYSLFCKTSVFIQGEEFCRN